MPFEQRDNSGTLFPNDRKNSDNHPDWTGPCMIGGVLYDMAAWTKSGQRGDFYSMSFKPQSERPPKREAGNPPRSNPPRQGGAQAPAPIEREKAAALDDDIPF